MAISRERLEELIKQGATVWRSMCGDIHKIRLDKRYFFCDDNKLCWHTIAKLMPRLFVDFEHLFETKEDAEEYAEFGNIKRIERLELPSWEEFKTTETITKFFNKDTNYSLYVYVKNKNTNNCKIMIYADNGEQEWWEFQKPLTRENYNEARRLCIKLFKGEN